MLFRDNFHEAMNNIAVTFVEKWLKVVFEKTLVAHNYAIR